MLQRMRFFTLCFLAMSACGQGGAEPENSSSVSSTSAKAEPPKDERLGTLVEQGQALIKRQLTDPYSAQFDDMRTNGDRSVLCGNVNSKNQMGGYAGPRPFIYDHSTGDALIQPFAGLPDTGSMSEFELQQGIKNTKAYTAAIGKCGFDRVRAVADGAYAAG